MLVNYNSDAVTSTTSLDIDRNEYIAKSSVNLAKEVTQLLVDIDGLDNSDLNEWVLKNPDSKVSERPINTRMSRFKNAFESIFPNKKFKKVSNSPGAKDVLFEEFGKQMSINNLSSGEKQIVFRGSFLLRNKRSTEGALILIDEPEISLHPNWQLNILNYYKNLFKDENGIQTSQIVVATHSPFIIHNDTRSDDIVIIFKKDENGNMLLSKYGEFYSWSGEEAIKEAFNIEILQEKIKKSPKHLIITEGKTDWKHLKRALNKLENPIATHIEFLEYEDNIEMGSSQLVALCQSLSKLQNNFKMIAIFDRDEPNIIKQTSGVVGSNFKNWGNNVYSFTLPVPEHRLATPNICIEHYYTDDEIKLYDADSRRLYMGNEFSQKIGLHKNEDKACVNKNKCGDHSIQIIDDGVCNIHQQDINIALPKSIFADYILNDIEQFNQVKSNNFSIVFDIISQIVDEGVE